MVAKSNKQSSQKEPKSFRPALTPEGQENRMISLAMDLAEKQLREGTASAQVQVHFLKLGTEKARLERTKLYINQKNGEILEERLLFVIWGAT